MNNVKKDCRIQVAVEMRDSEKRKGKSPNSEIVSSTYRPRVIDRNLKAIIVQYSGTRVSQARCHKNSPILGVA